MFYHFIDCKYGLQDITKKRIKVSRLSDLNDPYELAGIAFSDAELVAALDRTKAQLDKIRGVLCFSRDWANPVIWSHYADSHRGLCLGFERHGEDPAPVTYSGDLLTEEWFWDLLRLPDGPEKQAGTLKWLTHKFGTWHDQFDSSGCVGCGRCITWCPVGIDVTEELTAIRATDGGGDGNH